MVNAAGDLTTWGEHVGGGPWTIGIADPNTKHNPFSYLNISDMAVATSGNYEKYAIINGRKYSHTIDPKTGYPVSGIKSVTIICKSAELADALAKKGFDIDRRKIQLDEPLKSLGEYDVPIRLHRDVTARFKVTVKKEEGE